MFDLTKLRYLYNSRQQIFIRGREYYVSGAVREVKLFQRFASYEVDAVLQGTKLYKTMIKFDENNKYNSCHCTCPAFQQYMDPCKHVAALYFYLSESDKFNKSLNYIAGGEFLESYFSDISEKNKRRVNLEYQIQTISYPGNLFGYLSIKIGIDKMYIIKNIRQLLEQSQVDGILVFGKNFIYNEKIHEFKDEDKKIIEFLLELISAEKAIKSESYYAQGNIFAGKNVKLDEVLFTRFLILLNGRKFSLQHENEYIDNVTADFENYPFEIDIKKNLGKMEAEITYNKDCIFFKKYSNLIYSNKKLYVIDKKDKAFKFIKAAENNKVTKMEFSEENSDKLLSIIPGLVNNKCINVSTDILEQYVNTPLEVAIYIDKYKKGISLKLEYKYGDEIIDPIYKKDSNPYIIRDFEKEEHIMNIIDDAGFKVNDNVVHLDDVDKTYLFFRDMLPILSKYSNLFYTDEVKDMYLGRIKGYKSYARTRQGSGVIDISIDIEGINPKEIKDILKSIKEKKKYHKLKSGRFISLEGDKIDELSCLMDEVEEDELKNNTITLSKYRTIGIFQVIDKEMINNIENIQEVKKVISKIKNFENDDIVIPEIFKGVLRDYQVTGYKWMKTLHNVGLGGILADDMGLGKTLQAITLMYDGVGEPSIVITPSSLIFNWENEIKRFSPDLRTIVISGSKKSREEMLQEITDYDIIITSYPLLRRDIEMYEEIHFKYCILDEAQHIKNPESINAQSVKRIHSQSRFALTGTPMENSLIELWSLFDFLMPGYLMSKKKFTEKYEKNIFKNEDRVALSNFKKTIAPFILRRKKKDVLLELPEKIETTLVCKLTEAQKDIYTAYLLRARREIDNLIEEEGFEKSHIQILAAITRLRQICCHPAVFLEDYNGGSGKLDLLEELIEELVEGQHRILLFSQFTALLKIIKETINMKGIDYLYLDGSTPVHERMDLVNRFNSGFGEVFLISLKAGGTGLNLTSADVVIHFDPWWNPAVEDQATDRAHRIGQENVVQVFKLITKDTIEEKIIELQNRKKDLINAVIQDGEVFINKLTEEELLDLFKI